MCFTNEKISEEQAKAFSKYAELMKNVPGKKIYRLVID